MPRRTKIVATIGPASDAPEVLRGVLEAGADVARVGLAHGPLQTSLDRIDRVRVAAADLGRPVGVLVDLPGPKVRSAPFDADGVRLEAGSLVRLTEAADGDRSTAQVVAVALAGAVDALGAGDRVARGDGGVALRVADRTTDGVVARVLSGGVVRGRPGVSLPEDRVPLRSPTDDDLVLLEGVLEAGVDAVAVSFVQTADDVATIRRAVGPDGPMVVAKIETGGAVANMSDIVHVSDGVMVARGDLGVRLPLEDVPHIQKQIIRTGVAYGKPVITATQMLESMITAPTPTRAEVTDVANAVFDGTSAVMLSAETGVGEYPLQAVQAMAKIAHAAEESRVIHGRARRVHPQNAAATILHHAVQLGEALDVAAFVIPTATGGGARACAKYRADRPIIALVHDPVVGRQLTLEWGVIPKPQPIKETVDDLIEDALLVARDDARIPSGSSVVLTAGRRTGTPGATSLVMVREIP